MWWVKRTRHFSWNGSNSFFDRAIWGLVSCLRTRWHMWDETSKLWITRGRDTKSHAITPTDMSEATKQVVLMELTAPGKTEQRRQKREICSSRRVLEAGVESLHGLCGVIYTGSQGIWTAEPPRTPQKPLQRLPGGSRLRWVGRGSYLDTGLIPRSSFLLCVCSSPNAM